MTPTIARRHDWKTLPMPAARTTGLLARQYSDAEFARLMAGCIPREQENKWFIFYEAPWLFLHRSWTGFCIYQVRFAHGAGAASVAEVIVNQDPSQYRGGFNPAELGSLLDIQAGRNPWP